jgi:hypothetical protein
VANDLRRDLGHGDRTLRKLGDVAGDVVGGDHRLPPPDEDAQAHVIALRTLGFLDRALAHLDRKRHGAHRHRIGGIGTGAARRPDQPVGEFGERGLVKKRGHFREPLRLSEIDQVSLR